MQYPICYAMCYALCYMPCYMLCYMPPGGTGTSKRPLWEPLRPQNGGSGSHWGLGTTAPGATGASERPLWEPVRPQNGRSGSHWDLGKASGSHWDLGKAAPGANERKTNEPTIERSNIRKRDRFN